MSKVKRDKQVESLAGCIFIVIWLISFLAVMSLIGAAVYWLVSNA